MAESVPPCFCRQESAGEYVLVTKLGCSSDAPHLPNNQKMASGLFSKVRQVMMKVSHVAVGHQPCCECQGWKTYPANDDDDIEHEHSQNAEVIFVHLRKEIQERRQLLEPPVTETVLKKYKYLPGDNQFKCYYYLNILAGDNEFYLYVKVGIHKEFSDLQLLRLCSHDNTCDQ